MQVSLTSFAGSLLGSAWEIDIRSTCRSPRAIKLSGKRKATCVVGCDVDRNGGFPPLQPDSRSPLDPSGPLQLTHGATDHRAVAADDVIPRGRRGCSRPRSHPEVHLASHPCSSYSLIYFCEAPEGAVVRVRAYELDRRVEDKDVGRPRRRRVWATAMVLGACLVAGGACTPFPQNPAEFKRAVQQGGSGVYLQERTISRGFDTVFSGMSQSAERCLNVVHRYTTPGMYGLPVARAVYYRATISWPRPSVGEIVLQVDTSILMNAPEGGVYSLVADAEGLGASATKVTVYAGIKLGDIAARIFAWAEGNETACPEL
jgi:hypothetical protein